MDVPLQWPGQEAALLQVGQGARVLGGRGHSLPASPLSCPDCVCKVAGDPLSLMEWALSLQVALGFPHSLFSLGYCNV